MEIRRGDIYYEDLTPVVGCEQGGRRPVLVIQNDVGNHHGSTVIVAAITSRRRRKRRLPTHIGLPRLPTGLRTASFAMLEQVRTIDRMRLGAYIGRLDGERMAAVDRAILISFGLDGLVGYDGKNAEKIPDLVRKIVEAGEYIYSVNLIEPSLEDIYFALTAGRKEDRAI